MRYHRKGDSDLTTRARAVIIDVLIPNLYDYAQEIAVEVVGKLLKMVLATGGMDGELPRGIDLMFLYSINGRKDTSTKKYDEKSYILWDSDESRPCISRSQIALAEAQNDIIIRIRCWMQIYLR